MTPRLVAAGFAVRGLCRPTSDRAPLAALPVEWRVGDILEPDGLRAAADGCDLALHLASISSWSQLDSDAVEATVIDGSANVLAAVRAAGARRLVYVSSSVAVDAPRESVVFDERAPLTLE